MAKYYNSWTNRYGDTYDLSDDNSATLVSDQTNLALVNGEIKVDGSVRWNGTIGGSAADLVVFNKIIHFRNSTAEFTADGLGNRHMNFINCTIIFEEYAPGGGDGRDPVFGYTDDEDDAANTVERSDTPTTKSTSATLNLINCNVIMSENSNNSSTRLSILASDLTDTTFTSVVTDMRRLTVYSQPDANLDFLSLNGASLSSLYTDTFPLELLGEPRSFKQPQFTNLIVYNYEGGQIDIPGIEVAYAPVVPGEPDNEAIVTLGSGNSNNCIWTTGPAADFSPTGSVYYRGGSESNVSTVVTALEHEVRFFDDATQTNGRDDVSVRYDTTVQFTTNGNWNSLNALSTDYNIREYTSNSNGYPVGTFDFHEGTVSSTSFTSQSIPIQKRSRSSNNSSTVVDFETIFDARSLWGTSNATQTFNPTNSVNDEPDSDGSYISKVTHNLTDLEDTYMNAFANEGEITDGFSSNTATVGPTEIYGLQKLAWADFYPITDVNGDAIDSGFTYYPNNQNPYLSIETGDRFNLTGAKANVIELGVADTDNVSEFYEEDATTTTFRVRAGNLVAGSNETVDSIRATTIDLNSGYLAANVRANIRHPRRYSSLPTDFDTFYTAKDCSLEGNLHLPSVGSLDTFVLNNVTVGPAGCTIIRDNSSTVGDQNSLSGDVTVYFVNGTDASDFTISSLFDTNGTIIARKVVDVKVNFENSISSLSDISPLFFESADGSSFTAATATPTLASDGLSVTYRVELDPTVSGNEVYYSVYAKQHKIVAGKTDTDVEKTADAIATSSVNDDFSPTETDDVTALGSSNSFTVGIPTSNTGSFNITFSYTTAGLDVSNAAARKLIRDVETSTDFRTAMAYGRIPEDYFNYTEAGIEFLSQTEANRITFRRSAANFIWKLRVRTYVSDPAADLYDQLSTTAPNTYIEFLVDATGVQSSEVQNIVDTAVEDAITEIVNDIRGSSNRTNTEVYNKVRPLSSLLSLL